MSYILVNLQGLSLLPFFCGMIVVVIVEILFTDEVFEGEVCEALDLLEAFIFKIVILHVVARASNVELISRVIASWLRPLLSVNARWFKSRDSLFYWH